MIGRSIVSTQQTACLTRCEERSWGGGMSRGLQHHDAGLPPVAGRQPSAQAGPTLCAEPLPDPHLRETEGMVQLGAC
eukprot:4694501-Alexandrium_andersonii.AAC.1